MLRGKDKAYCEVGQKTMSDEAFKAYEQFGDTVPEIVAKGRQIVKDPGCPPAEPRRGLSISFTACVTASGRRDACSNASFALSYLDRTIAKIIQWALSA